jgi:Zn-dependent peptidase ImmA (M78 family)
MPVTELRRIQAQVNVARMQIARLLPGAEVEAVNEFFRIDIDETEGGPAEVARAVRVAWQLPDGPIPNLARAVERAGGIVLCCEFGTTQLDAISQWIPGLPPLFFVNRDAPVDRRRFSLAHEVGHVVMHRLMSDDAERQADEFASELLMSANVIRAQLSLMSLDRAAMMKPYWRVSMAALIRRARDLGCLSESGYRRLFTRMGQLGMRNPEPHPIADEEPSVLADLANIHLRHHGYTPAQLAQILNCREHDLFAWYLPHRPHLRLVE